MYRTIDFILCGENCYLVVSTNQHFPGLFCPAPWRTRHMHAHPGLQVRDSFSLSFSTRDKFAFSGFTRLVLHMTLPVSRSMFCSGIKVVLCRILKYTRKTTTTGKARQAEKKFFAISAEESSASPVCNGARATQHWTISMKTKETQAIPIIPICNQRIGLLEHTQTRLFNNVRSSQCTLTRTPCAHRRHVPQFLP